MAFFNNVVFCVDSDTKDFDDWSGPGYNITAWEHESVKSSPKDDITYQEQDNVASDSVEEKKWDYPLETAEPISEEKKGKIAQLISFLKNKFPSCKNVKCLLKKAAALGLVVGGAVVSVYGLVKVAKCVAEQVTNIARGVSKIAALAAVFYVFMKIKR